MNGPAPRSPSSLASVDAALRALDSMLRDDDDGGGGIDENGGSPVGSLPLPSFDARGAFTSYERREGPLIPTLSGESSPSAHMPDSRSNVSGRSTDNEKRQRAMERFVRDPSRMHWEDLVKAMKTKRKRKRGQQSWSFADRLASSTEDWHSSPGKTIFTEEMTFAHSLDDGDVELQCLARAADGEAWVPEEIDFFPPKLPSSSRTGAEVEDVAIGSATLRPDEAHSSTRAVEFCVPARRYAVACVVGFALGITLVRILWGLLGMG